MCELSLIYCFIVDASSFLPFSHVMIFVGILVALLVLAVAGMFSIYLKNRKTDQKCKYYSQMLELDHLHCVKV